MGLLTTQLKKISQEFQENMAKVNVHGKVELYVPPSVCDVCLNCCRDYSLNMESTSW